MDTSYEAEQLDKLKQWWQTKGWLTVLVILTLALVYGGWRMYEEYRVSQSEQASNLYQLLLDRLAQPSKEEDSHLSEGELTALINQLQTEYEGTFYATLATLQQAQQAIEKGHFQAAADVLMPLIVEPEKETAVELTARLRLARVWVQLEQTDKAIELLNAVTDPDFLAEALEIKGDALQQAGDVLSARTVYQSAKNALKNQQGSDGLQRKIDYLSVNG